MGGAASVHERGEPFGGGFGGWLTSDGGKLESNRDIAKGDETILGITSTRRLLHHNKYERTSMLHVCDL